MNDAGRNAAMKKQKHESVDNLFETEKNEGERTTRWEKIQNHNNWINMNRLQQRWASSEICKLLQMKLKCRK